MEMLGDGSYLSQIRRPPSANVIGEAFRAAGSNMKSETNRNAVCASGATRYRGIASVLKVGAAPAETLTRLYHGRWEIETAFDAFKTHLRGAGIHEAAAP